MAQNLPGTVIGIAADGTQATKQQPIGGYVQCPGPTTVLDSQTANPDPGAIMNFAGPAGRANYDYNAQGEAIGLLCFGNQGATIGKSAQWIQLGTGGLTAAQSRVNISAGVGTFNAAGTHDVFASLYMQRTLPINTYCWAFER